MPTGLFLSSKLTLLAQRYKPTDLYSKHEIVPWCREDGGAASGDTVGADVRAGPRVDHPV